MSTNQEGDVFKNSKDWVKFLRKHGMKSMAKALSRAIKMCKKNEKPRK